MTYFSNLPTIYYDFNINGVNVSRVLRDISVNVRVHKEVLESVTAFDLYDIEDGETPDIVSERVYGTPLYHWLIMLLNERFDYIHDWPLSTDQLTKHIEEKYGVGQGAATHHYRNQFGHIITLGDKYFDPHVSSKRILSKIETGNNIVRSSVVNGFATINDGASLLHVAGIGIPQFYQVEIIQFIDDSSFVMNMNANETIEVLLEFFYLIDPMANAVAVSNFEHEMEINEQKRRIRLIHPTVIGSVVKQLKALTNG